MITHVWLLPVLICAMNVAILFSRARSRISATNNKKAVCYYICSLAFLLMTPWLFLGWLLETNRMTTQEVLTQSTKATLWGCAWLFYIWLTMEIISIWLIKFKGYEFISKYPFLVNCYSSLPSRYVKYCSFAIFGFSKFLLLFLVIQLLRI